MAITKVPFTNLKLKLYNDVNILDFNGIKIEIKKYLPIADKYDLIMIALQKSEENGIYNPIKLRMHFLLNIVYMYTNINFTEKQREDEEKLFDLLQYNDLLTQIIENVDEYNKLEALINECVEKTLQYRNSAAAVIQSIIQDLPRNAEAAMNIVNSFDKEKYQAVVDFAKHANADRPI